MDVYTLVGTGELAGAAAATQCPDVDGKLMKFKAASDNAGSFYIGKSGVTARNGTTDTTTGWELAPGEDSGWIPVDSLSSFYFISAVGDDATYMVLG